MFLGAFVTGIGNGAELIAIPILHTLGVWSSGILVLKIKKKLYFSLFLRTLAGSFVGVGLILITPAIGYVQLLFPLVGAILGFYFKKN